MPKELPTISLHEIMRGEGVKKVPEMGMMPVRRGRKKAAAAVVVEGGAMLTVGRNQKVRLPGGVSSGVVVGGGAELLSNQPAGDPNTNIIEGDMEGGKIKIGRTIKRGYKKYVRPTVTAIVKEAEPHVKRAIMQQITPALITAGIPAPLATIASKAATDLSAKAVKEALNRSGVTAGAGIRGAGVKVPNFSARIGGRKVGVMLGGALSAESDEPVQMSSSNLASFSAARMQLVKAETVPEVREFRTTSLPPQMQSNPQFTNMQLIGEVQPMRMRGRGLYMGSGLYLSGRSGRGLY